MKIEDVHHHDILLCPFGSGVERFVVHCATQDGVAVRFLRNDTGLGDWWILPPFQVALAIRIGKYFQPADPPWRSGLERTARRSWLSKMFS